MRGILALLSCKRQIFLPASAGIFTLRNESSGSNGNNKKWSFNYVLSCKRLNVLCQQQREHFCYLAFPCKPYERHLGFIKLQEANFFCQLGPALAYFHWEMEVQDSGSNGNKKIRSFNCTKQQEAKYSLLSLEREHFGFSNLQEAIFLLAGTCIYHWKMEVQGAMATKWGERSEIHGNLRYFNFKNGFLWNFDKNYEAGKIFFTGGGWPPPVKIFYDPPLGLKVYDPPLATMTVPYYDVHQHIKKP